MDTKTITAMETVAGGKLITVIREIEKPDGVIDTQPEQVRVRQLKIKKFPEYAMALDNEPALAELLCGKPTGWSNDLSNESLQAIVQEGKRLNAVFFDPWVARKLEAAELLSPGITKAMINQRVSLLTTTSPDSPSKSG